MASGTKQVIEYREFSGGEFGVQDPWNAPRNTFTGKNMLVYRTGELGVRPGLRDISPSGLVPGVVWKVGAVLRLPFPTVWFGQGTAFRRFTVDGALTTYGTGLTGGSTPTGPDDVGKYETGSDFYVVTNTGAGLYQGDESTVTKLSGTPSSENIALYGDRLVISQPSDTLRYNGVTAGVSDLTSWPATNTIPVGDDTSITGLLPQRGHLSILKFSGGNYILSGALSVNEVLRQANFLNGSTDSLGNGRAFDERIWFMAEDEDFPTFWDGSNTVSRWQLSMPENGSFSVHVEPMRAVDPEGVLFVGDTGGWALVYSNGVWTKHQFGATFARMGTNAQIDFHPDPGDASGLTQNSCYYVLCDGGGASTIPKFFGWSPLLNRPGSETHFNNEIPERAGDLSSQQVSGEVAFPIWHDGSGSEFYVRGVEVDFRSWNTGGSLTNHFDVQVDSYHRFNGDAPVESLKAGWDEAGSVSSTGGTARREVFLFGDQGLGNGFQLRFTNVRGIAFQRIHVIIDMRPPRGV